MLGLAGLLFAAMTISSLRPLPLQLDPPPGTAVRPEVLDRHGERLAISYSNRWNVDDRVALYEVPPPLRLAVVRAEDKRFFEHGGVDWRARAAASWQNLRAGRIVRGASTISEQVVRLLHPRPRTLYSRWLEGIEVRLLEARFGKGQILEFYLNQVPFAHRRRGLLQAAHDLFGRDLDTLSRTEMLALAVLIRSPSGLDPSKGEKGLRRRMGWLAEQLAEEWVGSGGQDAGQIMAAVDGPLVLASLPLRVAAPAFIRAARERATASGPLRTTLDASLQAEAQRLLDAALARMRPLGAGHAAALVLDHRDDAVRVWANARSGTAIDAVRIRRQPGSTLKPFVYGLALERGSTAASLIDDLPLLSPVGAGLHRYRNFSGQHHGAIRLRLALANSLNIPAVRTMERLPKGLLLGRLRRLGFVGLSLPAEHYGAGLALGNGEVTLEELVGAYAVLARGGVHRPARLVEGGGIGLLGQERRLFDPEVTSLLTDILSDDEARALEFGRRGALALPMPAALKTGTSNDHRDAWAVGFSDRYVVGVWMGDLEQRPMRGITGSTGPAPVLRALLGVLHAHQPAASLPRSSQLVRAAICAETGELASSACPAADEWFRPAYRPQHVCARHGERLPSVTTQGPGDSELRLEQPTPGLHLAMDPRIPDVLEAFEFSLVEDPGAARVEWMVDDLPVNLPRASARSWRWQVSHGRHSVQATLWRDDGSPSMETARVAFFVR